MKAKTVLAVSFFLLALPLSAQAAARFFPGDALVIVKVEIPQKNTEYVVKSGDTLSKISKTQGAPLKDILAANKGLDPKKLRVGQKILIPSKDAKTPAKTVAMVPEKVTASVPQTGQAKTASDASANAQGKAKVTPAAPATPAADGAKTAEASAPVTSGKADGGKPHKQPISKTLAAMKTAPEAAPQTPPSAKAYGKTGIITNATDVPMAIREEFNNYGRKWLDVSEELAVGTKNNKKVRKVGNVWEASYRVILKDTMGTEVKRVQYDHTPYVGHLTYAVLAYVSTGPTKDAALNGAYEEKEEHMREIFSYDGKKKAWR